MKYKFFRGLFFISILICFQPFSAAQTSGVSTVPDNQSLSGSVIRINSNLVSVPISVSDASGRVITDLKIEDFRLTEDGKSAEISKLADSSQSNLNIALLFDVSGSLHNNFEFEQNAAINFLKKIWKDGDAVTIISFDEQLDVLLKNGDNLQETMWHLRQLRPTEKPTSFFDAVILGAQLIDQYAPEENRQAIIVISDGADNTSAGNLATALSEIQRRNAVFFAINPSGASIRLNRINVKGQENLEELAKATGGDVFVSDDTGDLENIFGKIEMELRAQYLLHYYSLNSNMDGKFHKIEVSIPKRPNLNIRARPGFLAIPRQTFDY